MEITNTYYDRCDICLDKEGPFAVLNESYESGATICLACAEETVASLRKAIEHRTHPKESDPLAYSEEALSE